jgi:hypothetical protein
MAVKKIKGEWISTLTGQPHGSKEAAEFYDQREQMRMRGEQADVGEAILDKLSTPELEAVVRAAVKRSDEISNRSEAEANAREFIDSTPEFIPNPESVAAVSAYLKGRGYGVPYSPQLLRDAFLDLVDLGVVIPKEIPKDERFDEEAAYNMPMSELEDRARGRK